MTKLDQVLFPHNINNDSRALLALEDGTVFYGFSIGVSGYAVGEVVFNTAMTGYQEILSDPSYAEQMVTLTYPHIGNTGTNGADDESKAVYATGLIIRDCAIKASSWRNEESLPDYLMRHNVVAISDIDTRELTHKLRNSGSLKACLMAGDNIDEAHAVSLAVGYSGLAGKDLAKEVSVKTSYRWDQGSYDLDSSTFKRNKKKSYHVVCYDYGIKNNILRMLADLNCDLTVVPAQTSTDEVMQMNPDGIFLSNGPGDPAACHYAIDACRQFLKKDIPLFGICLGHQILALASGAQTEKMKFGHHGANHPVENCVDKTVLITSQNHNFSVSEKRLPDHLKITYRSLFDGSVQGIERVDKLAYGFQGHPEASPGPHEAGKMFEKFIMNIEIRNKEKVDA